MVNISLKKTYFYNAGQIKSWTNNNEKGNALLLELLP